MRNYFLNYRQPVELRKFWSEYLFNGPLTPSVLSKLFEIGSKMLKNGLKLSKF